MREIRETLMEVATTDWRGARVRVSIEVPQLQNSISSQIILDELDLEQLRGLAPPVGLYSMGTESQRIALNQWDIDRKKADNVLEMIARKVTLQLGVVIERGLKEQR